MIQDINIDQLNNMAEALKNGLAQTTVGYDVAYYDALNTQLLKIIMHMKSININIFDTELNACIKSHPDLVTHYEELNTQLRQTLDKMIDKLTMPTSVGKHHPAGSSLIQGEMEIVGILGEMYQLFTSAPFPQALKLETFTTSARTLLVKLKNVLGNDQPNRQAASNIINYDEPETPIDGSITPSPTGLDPLAITSENIEEDLIEIKEEIQSKMEEDIEIVVGGQTHYKNYNNYGTQSSIEKVWNKEINDLENYAKHRLDSFVDGFLEQAHQFQNDSLKALSGDTTTPLTGFVKRLGQDNLYNTFFGIHKSVADFAGFLADNIKLNSLATLWNLYPEITCIVKWLLAQVCMSNKPIADIDQHCEVLDKIEQALELLSLGLSFKGLDIRKILDSLINELAGKALETIVSLVGNIIDTMISQLIDQLLDTLKVDDRCSPLKCVPFDDLIHEILDFVEAKRDDLMRWISDFLANLINYDESQKQLLLVINKSSRFTKLIELVRELKELCRELAKILKASPQQLFNQFTDTALGELDSQLEAELEIKAKSTALKNLGIPDDNIAGPETTQASKNIKTTVDNYNNAKMKKEAAAKIIDEKRIYGEASLKIKRYIDEVDIDSVGIDANIAAGYVLIPGLATTTKVPDDMMDYYKAVIEYKRMNKEISKYSDDIRDAGLSTAFFSGFSKVLTTTGNDRIFDGQRFRKAPDTNFDGCFCGKHTYRSPIENSIPAPSGETPPPTGTIPPDILRKTPKPETNGTNNNKDTYVCEEDLEAVRNEIKLLIEQMSLAQGAH